MSAKNHELPERLGGLIEGETNTLSFSGLTTGDDNESQKAAFSLDLLQRYIGEIRQYPVLDKDEECRLAREYKELDNLEAGHKLINLKPSTRS